VVKADFHDHKVTRQRCEEELVVIIPYRTNGSSNRSTLLWSHGPPSPPMQGVMLAAHHYPTHTPYNTPCVEVGDHDIEALLTFPNPSGKATRCTCTRNYAVDGLFCEERKGDAFPK
jgi:hypothetical protein